MDTPRILAIDDVFMSAPADAADGIIDFYSHLIGLDPIGGASPEDRIAFRGYPRSGPRLIVNLTDEPVPTSPQRRILIQLASLADLAEQMAEQRWPFVWYRGWFYYDRQLIAHDPAGHLVGFVAYHRF